MSKETLLHRFDAADLQQCQLPQKMNDPFNGQPHPLCIRAAHKVGQYIGKHTEWVDELQHGGKMFGVLIVLDKDGQPGYLAAYSGLLNRQNVLPYFVPPIYDMLQPDGFFKTGERQIDAINRQVNLLMAADDGSEAEIKALKRERRQRSAALQQQLFEHFIVQNAQGRRANLIEVFQETIQRTPPGGTGECAAPKLLQYAFTNGLTPLSVAEFWQGASTVYQPRQHNAFYPACEEKCRPLLSWMLRGLIP